MRANSLVAFLIFLPLIASAQTPEFQIAKITKNLIPTPQLAYTGGPQHQNQTNQRDRWLEVEVEFKAAPELTNELTFKYYILFNGTLLTGEVTHVNVPAGPRKPFGETQPQLQSALLRLSSMISQYFTAAFPRKVFGTRDRRAKGPRSDRA